MTTYRYRTYLRQRYRAILGYSGLICIIIGLLQCSPLLLLAFYPQEAYLLLAFLTPGVSLVVIGFLLWRLLGPKGGFSLSYREGAAIVVVGWFAALLIGAVPFMLGIGMTFTLAMFESTSGWTTTGLSVVDVSTAPHLILFYRSIMQLAGGAGLAIITLSALVGPAGSGISAAEGRGEQLAPHVKRSTRLVLTLYLIYCVGGTLALHLAGMEWFDAVNHAFAALSTGGFSTRVESIGYWNSPAIEAVVMVLMFLGTLNFVTAYTLFRGNFRAVLRNGELRLAAVLSSVAILVLFTGVVSAADQYPTLGKQMRVAVFEAITALSTTGFSTVSYTGWNSLGWLTLLFLMLVGGGTGSTAGAMKQYRIYVLYRAILWEVRRLVLPANTVTEPDIWQGESRSFLSDAQIRQVGSFVFLYLMTVFVGSAIIASYGYPLQDSLFEFASSVGTIGLSIGLTDANAPPGIHWTQIAGMALGRLEFFTIIVGLHKLFGDIKTYTRG